MTNLYTIVPLRAANSRTLVEQFIGRGLRLPYGKRTGVPAVDRLTIVAHDRFDDIISEANDQKSIIRTGVVLGRDIDFKPKRVIEIHSNLNSIITGQPVVLDVKEFFESSVLQLGTQKLAEQEFLFHEEEKEIAIATIKVIKEFEYLPNSKKLKEKEIQKEIVKCLEENSKLHQEDLEGIIKKPSAKEVVMKVIQAYIENTIDIPRIILTPKNLQSYSFEKLTLDTSGFGRFNPVEQKILIQHLRTAEREKIQSDRMICDEERLENYIVSMLTDFNDISYDHHADILYDLASQMLVYLRSYLSAEEDVLNVLQYYSKELENLIHAQMQSLLQAWLYRI